MRTKERRQREKRAMLVLIALAFTLALFIMSEISDKVEGMAVPTVVYAASVGEEDNIGGSTDVYLSDEELHQQMIDEIFDGVVFPEEWGDIQISEDVLKYMFDMSLTYRVPFELALAVCYTESRFTCDVNNAGLNSNGTTDYGLMGLNDAYIEYNCELYNDGNVIDMCDPYENVYIGIRILSDNLERYDGDIYDAACAYNLGPTGWDNLKASGGTWEYGDKILECLGELNFAVS